MSKNVSSVLLSNELSQFCKSESLSEDSLREIIERHESRLVPPNDRLVLLGDCDCFLSACISDRVTKGIIQCLLEYFPDKANTSDEDGWTPLHVACGNPDMTKEIIQILFDAAPESIRSVTNQGNMPLHTFMNKNQVDVNILKFLIERYPQAIRHTNSRGCLPIHLHCASGGSPEFCGLLIEAYPGSERIADANGALPLHVACLRGGLATVQYLYKFYPDAINHQTNSGLYPIHCAMSGYPRNSGKCCAEIVRFLLDCDPNVTLQKFGVTLTPLEFACRLNYDDSNIQASLEAIKSIYDALPQYIEEIEPDIQNCHEQVQSFINSEFAYALQAKDHLLMTSPDESGQLPLHTALQNNVRLGSIKLLVRGNLSALRTSDNKFAMPLHIACQHHHSPRVVQYLLDLDLRTLQAVDVGNNTALHYACRGAKYDTIALLLDHYDSVLVSKRNAQNKLPIDLLWESHGDCDRESIEYTESVFRLLRAHPETLMNYNGAMNHTGSSDSCSPQDRKKRKLGAV